MADSCGHGFRAVDGYPVRLRRDAGQASEVTPELTRAAIPNFSRDFFHGQHGIDKEACRGVDAAAVDMRSEP